MNPKKTIIKSSRRRTMSFSECHKIRFGVQPTSRYYHSGAVTAVACRFCVTFGREKHEKSRRGPVQSNKIFRAPFRTDNYLSHLKSQHSQKWKEYNDAQISEKKAFFDVEVPYVEKITSHFGTEDKLTFTIGKQIVNKIIIELLTGREDSLQRIQRNCLFDFDMDNEKYLVTIKKGSHFRMTIGNVSLGMSFRQAYKSARVAKNVWGLGALSGLTEKMVSQYIQAVVAVNLQHISQLLCHKNCWGYSIAFDSATNHGNSYIDVRVRLCVLGRVQNLHVLAIPFYESHTGEGMFAVISSMLEALMGATWCKKLISVATDCRAKRVRVLSERLNS